MAASMALRCLLRRVPGSAALRAPSAAGSMATQSQQLQGGPRTIAKLQDKNAKQLGEEFRDYKIYRRRRADREAALESRDRAHNARVLAVGGAALSTLAVIGVLAARLRMRAKPSPGDANAQVYTSSP